MASPADAERNTTGVATAADPWTVNLPGSISAGDLLIVYCHRAANTSMTVPAGWTAVPDIDGGTISNIAGGGGDWCTVIYREADGSEGATLSVDMAATAKGCALAWRITGAEDPATQAPQGQLFTTGTATANSCNPPSLTPTGGSKDYLWLAIGHGDGESPSAFTAAPTNYSNFINTNSGTGGTPGTNNVVGGGSRQLTASSEDPGVFTHTALANGYTGITIAVHPAGAAAATSLVWRSRPAIYLPV